MTKKYQDIIAAEKTSIGFDYQFLYFVYRLISLEPGEKIGYEVKDDVHLEFSDNTNVYIQLKHSLNIDANVTDKDPDLWKTLYNWIKIVNELTSKEEKLNFLDRTNFLLVTTKSNNNSFINMIFDFVNNKKVISELKVYKKTLLDSFTGTSDSTKVMKKYVNELLCCEDEILSIFLKKLDFSFLFDNMIDKLKDKILAKNIDSKNVDSALNEIVGTFDLWKFETVKNKNKIYIDFSNVNNKIKPILEKARSNELPRSKQKVINPNNLEEQAFIKELIDMEDISISDMDLILTYTTYKMKITNELNAWIEEGYITELDRANLESEAITIWQNKHRQSHRKNNNNTPKAQLDECAQKCIDDLREKILSLNSNKLYNDESNGVFYYLSDEGNIGWQYKWKEKY